MRKAITFLCIILLVGGCSSCNKANTVKNPDAQSDTTNEQNANNSSTGSNTDQIQNNNSTATNMFINGTYEFSGEIGNSKIYMTLINKDNQLTGAYYYDKYQTDINLNGSVELIYKDYPTISLSEDTEQKG